MEPKRRTRVGIAVLGLGLAMTTAGVTIDARAESQQSSLESEGVRAQGTVVEARYDAKAPDAVEIQFLVEGILRTAIVYIDGTEVGDTITVLVDPDDHRRVGVEGGTQLTGLRFGAVLFLMLQGLFVITPIGLWLLLAPLVRRARQRENRSTA